ncbi:MAG: cell division protein SepF [Fimbriimonadaceae bacterium]
MDEIELQEKTGLFSRLTNLFSRQDEEDESEEAGTQAYPLRSAYRYHVTIRRYVTQFDEAYAAASGLKRGEQQILNLAHTEPALRQKIVDFMSGVSFAQDANWEEIGDNIYLITPGHAFVEVAPSEKKANGLFRN